MPRVSSLSGTCSETMSDFAEELFLRDAPHVGGKVAVDDVRVAGDHAAEDVARDVRHALADAPEAEDAEGELGRARKPAGRGVVPLPGADVAVVATAGGAPARAPSRARASRPRPRRSRANWRPRRRSFCASSDVDGVEARAEAAHDAHLGQRRRTPSRSSARTARAAPSQPFAAAITSSSVRHCAVATSMPGVAEQPQLQVDIGEVVVGDEELPSGCPAARRSRSCPRGSRGRSPRSPGSRGRRRASSSRAVIGGFGGFHARAALRELRRRSTCRCSLRFATSSSIRSPFFTSASGPPAAASGATCSTTVP